MMGAARPVHALHGPAPVEFDPFVKPHQPCTVISVFGSSNDMCMYQVCTRYQVSDRALFSPCPSRLLLSVRVLILTDYENLHVHFEDCDGRRVANVSGAFLELAPSSGSSSDAFHINMQQYLYLP